MRRNPGGLQTWLHQPEESNSIRSIRRIRQFPNCLFKEPLDPQIPNKKKTLSGRLRRELQKTLQRYLGISKEFYPPSVGRLADLDSCKSTDFNHMTGLEVAELELENSEGPIHHREFLVLPTFVSTFLVFGMSFLVNHLTQVWLDTEWCFGWWVLWIIHTLYIPASKQT